MAKPGKPRKIGPPLWTLIAAELDAGATYEHVQRELAVANPPIEISIAMLQKYRAEDRRKLRGGKPDVEPDQNGVLAHLNARASMRRGGETPLEEPAPAEPMPDGTDLGELLRRQLKDSAERAERARRLGDSVVAAREAKNMAELSRQLAAYNRDKASSRDVLTFSRADLEAGMRSVREKVFAVQLRTASQGGLMCAGCARELAAALTGVDLTPPTVEQAS